MLITDIDKYITKVKGAIHVGGNDGWERDWYNRMGFNKVLWFEPYNDAFLKLKVNINNYPNQLAVNLGVHDTLKTATLHIASNKGQSSSILEWGTHKDFRPDITFIKDQKIELVRLDEFINHEYIKEFNFLNVDVQGVELNVLKSLGELISGFNYIYTEVNEAQTYKGCSQMVDIDKYLSTYGFKREVTHMEAQHWGDAFYIKNGI